MTAAAVPVRHLTLAEVLDLARHACLAQDQPVELRDPGLLESAVHRPRARMLGTPAYEDPYEQAAALLHGIATNHPLVDGNKRTAWLAAATFLAVNGADPGGVDQDDAYRLVVDVAAGRESAVGRIAARLRALLTPPM
ncbi:type II toxin-antitoxin system death-on-curing family toxin [Streptomyces venezuelae]|uniref:Type II toxin-antitoxin system death-on-curing family toxin n=1 Tax=Streptomyces venezuelae TaxID=54571 RepID=A0A5P2DIA7_STRVZ|nr:type II toxin-antitoxin system death-on-curing family toxin [Streptomyces venezuelae]QES54894.1 type II toxin-antitoxin system death-on-curing family toxin [Streptomyces venezuelae]